MRHAYRVTAILFTLVLIVNCSGEQTAGTFPEEGKVRIIRDTWGVPHIYASTEYDAAYGLGWAMAEDRVQQIFASKMMAMGRMAEIAGESALENDIAIRSFQVYEKGSALVGALEPEVKAYIQAFCRGVNDYTAANREALPPWADTLEVKDVTSIGVMINLYFPLSRLQRQLQELERELNSNDQRGSNQFAVAASRSASGNAMLSIDPHLAFEGPLAWAEAHVITPNHNIAGNIIPGAPVINMGHNGYIAWSNTNNFPDLQDLYAFPLADEEGKTYRSHDGVREFDIKTAVFKIKTEEGTIERERTLMISHAGPVLKVEDGTAYVGRVSGYAAGSLFEQALQRSRAQSIEEYFAAFRKPGMAMWNQMVADTEGNIGYLWNGLVPKRNPELDWEEVIPGDDPRSEWDGFIGYETFPKVINPESGWLQNCNDSPWHVTSSGEIEPDDLEDWMIFTRRYGFRGKRITQLLSADESVTLEEMKTYAQDAYVLEAEWWVPRLIEAYEKFESEMGLADSTTETAINTLKNWDLTSSPDARGMALFHNWLLSSGVRAYYQDEERLSDDIMRKQLLELTSVAEELKSAFGQVDVAWGDVLYLPKGEREFAMGGGGYLESMLTLWGPSLDDGSGRMRAHAGSSYRMIVEMSETPKAYTAFPHSMSENPESPHFHDITGIYAAGEYKPLPFTWEEVQDHAAVDVTFAIGSPLSTHAPEKEAEAK